MSEQCNDRCEWLSYLENLIKEKGKLEVSYYRGYGVSLNWSASIGGKWPHSHGDTFEGALKDLVHTYKQIEREQLMMARLKDLDKKG